jgi:CheY-like chemotaxis protein
MTARPRVIVALPDSAEGAAVADWLSTDGFEPVRRPTPRAAVDEIQSRAFDLVIADAALALGSGLHTLARARNPLPPTILIGDASGTGSKGASGQTICLTRPIDRATLACFVSMAILDRRPLRRSTRKPVNRFDAFVNGMPSHIIDVSAEGLRLELPRDTRTALPPHFTVRVPLVGIAITAQRMWVRSSTGRASTMWYGGALSQNRPSTERAWRAFVDTIPVIGETGVQVDP